MLFWRELAKRDNTRENLCVCIELFGCPSFAKQIRVKLCAVTGPKGRYTKKVSVEQLTLPDHQLCKESGLVRWAEVPHLDTQFPIAVFLDDAEGAEEGWGEGGVYVDARMA